MFIFILILALIGFAVSAYTYFLEQKLKTTPDYKPFCDINETVSCTRAMSSEYANALFLPNSLIGVSYYTAIALLSFFNIDLILLILSSIGLIMTGYLAYLLYFKIKAVCLLCTTTYVINVLIFVIALSQYL